MTGVYCRLHELLYSSVFQSIVCITLTSLPIKKGLLQHFYFFHRRYIKKFFTSLSDDTNRQKYLSDCAIFKSLGQVKRSCKIAFPFFPP